MSWRLALAIAGGVATVLSAGCAYTVAAPPPLNEAVRIEIAVDDARLVRAQAYLQAAIANAIQGRLGWAVSPRGSARIALTLKQEAIQTIATTTLDVPASWSVTLKGSALFDSQHGHVLTTYQGTGYTTPGIGFDTALSAEPAALQAASDAAALIVVAWLDAQAMQWK